MATGLKSRIIYRKKTKESNEKRLLGWHIQPVD